MPDQVVLDRLIEIAEFMLQAPIPVPTRKLLAGTVDAVGAAPFQSWLATWAAVQAESNPDKRLVIREQTQEGWVNGMRQLDHALPRALVAIYDAANAPIAPGSPPLTAEAADAVLDLWRFQSQVVNGAAADVSPAQRATWRQQLAACYPQLDAAQQQWIAAAPLTSPMMRAAWKDLKPQQRETQRQAMATYLPQLSMFVQAVMQAGPASAAGGPQPQRGVPPARWASQPQASPRQAQQNDQAAIRALQNVSNYTHQAAVAVAHNLRA
jgi:hypothetical protein